MQIRILLYQQKQTNKQNSTKTKPKQQQQTPNQTKKKNKPQETSINSGEKNYLDILPLCCMPSFKCLKSTTYSPSFNIESEYPAIFAFLCE